MAFDPIIVECTPAQVLQPLRDGLTLFRDSTDGFLKGKRWDGTIIVFGGGGGAGVQLHLVTYAQLFALVGASGLVQGDFYLITDFTTVYTIPNTAQVNVGTVEPIILYATDVNMLDNNATSTLFPQDKLSYELVDSSTAGGTKGRIYFRQDTKRNITTWYDWRNVQFRRWETAPASGIFTVLTDNGGAFLDFYTFNNSSSALNCNDTIIGRLDSTSGITNGLNNIVIRGKAQINTFGADCFDCTFTGTNPFFPNVWNNIIESKFSGNTIGELFYSNRIRTLCIGNTIGNNFAFNDIGVSFTGNAIGNLFQVNRTGDNFNSNTIGNNFQRNYIEGQYSSNIIADDFQENNIGNQCSGNNIGNTCQRNIIGNLFNANVITTNFTDNQIADNFISNPSIADSFQFNQVGNGFSGNTILNNFQYNVIGANFSTNNIGNGFDKNVISTDFNNNISIGDGFAKNVIGTDFNNNVSIGVGFVDNNIGNRFSSNTIGATCTNNRIGNDFISNTIGTNFVNNKIGDNFGFNTITNGFNLNNIGFNFANNITVDNFQNNTICPNLPATDFTLATFVYTLYQKEIFENSAVGFRLRYTDGADVIQYANPNA